MQDKRGKWRTAPQVWETLKPLARSHRRQPTGAEGRLWSRIRNGRIEGFKFRRQHAIERFIVDFYCPAARLVIEVDGRSHDENEADDRAREAYFAAQGLRILRFTNDQVLSDIEGVVPSIKAALSSPSPLTERGAGG
jgi:very-short-patch-repair endonuclease